MLWRVACRSELAVGWKYGTVEWIRIGRTEFNAGQHHCAGRYSGHSPGHSTNYARFYRSERNNAECNRTKFDFTKRRTCKYGARNHSKYNDTGFDIAQQYARRYYSWLDIAERDAKHHNARSKFPERNAGKHHGTWVDVAQWNAEYNAGRDAANDASGQHATSDDAARHLFIIDEWRQQHSALSGEVW